MENPRVLHLGEAESPISLILLLRCGAVVLVVVVEIRRLELVVDTLAGDGVVLLFNPVEVAVPFRQADLDSRHVVVDPDHDPSHVG